MRRAIKHHYTSRLSENLGIYELYAAPYRMSGIIVLGNSAAEDLEYALPFTRMGVYSRWGTQQGIRVMQLEEYISACIKRRGLPDPYQEPLDWNNPVSIDEDS